MTGGVDGASTRFSYTLSPANQREWSVRYTGVDWHVSKAPEGPPEIGIHASWQGVVESTGTSPLESDPDLIRQLRALGYLE